MYFYVAFLPKHRHEIGGKVFTSGIMARFQEVDSEKAEGRVMELFGDQWSEMYEEGGHIPNQQDYGYKVVDIE